MPKVIDLFCGAGGLSEGFRQAGFEVLLGIDFNKYAIETHHYNFPDSISLHADITKLNPEQLFSDYQIHMNKIDGVIGGFPCQGFSIAGKRWVEDPRNKLFLECVRFVEAVQPSFFVFENVPGLVSMADGKIKDEIIETLSNLGYNVDAKVLTATDYLVPQIRKRVFFIGFKEGTPSFPSPLTDKPITVGDSIMDLPELGLNDGQEEWELENGLLIYNHTSVGLSPLNLQRICHIPEGGNCLDIPNHLQRAKIYQSAYRRLDREKPSYTIHTHFRDEFLIHPTQDRVVTVREAARLQSFPDSFRFVGPKSREGQHGAVGNAVPPLMAKAIGDHILKTLF